MASDDAMQGSQKASAYQLNAAQRSLAWYSRHATRARMGYWISDLVLVVLGAMIPVVTISTKDPLFPTLIGAAVVVLTGMRRVFQWERGWTRFTWACVELQTELVRFEQRLAPYDGADAQSRLAMNVREIEARETQDWMGARDTASAVLPGGPSTT